MEILTPSALHSSSIYDGHLPQIPQSFIWIIMLALFAEFGGGWEGVRYFPSSHIYRSIGMSIGVNAYPLM